MTTQQRSQNRAQDVYRFVANDDGQRMKPQYTDAERRAAQLTIAAHATDVEDARLLLALCGLLPEGAREPGARAARWDTGWEGK